MASLEHPQFRLIEVRVLRSSFEALDTERLEERPKDQTDSSFNITVLPQGPLLCASILTLAVRPWKGLKPYAVEVQVGGLFGALGGATDEQLSEFCALGSPSVLYPLVREVVHTLTKDGGSGPLLLPLLNMNELVQRHRAQLAPRATTPPTPERVAKKKQRQQKKK